MPDRQSLVSILFCCMGNICRSPTAEGVFRKKLILAGLAQQVRVDSCGTHAYHVGEAPDRRSQKHALARGYDLSPQRARQVDVTDFEKFDLILAMDEQNLANLRRICPKAYLGRLRLMLDFSTQLPAGDVPDPYYGGDAGFEQVLDLIEEASDQLITYLRAEFGLQSSPP